MSGSGVFTLCRITHVNYEQYTVDVDTVTTNKSDITDIPVASMYAHQHHGGTAFSMPEIGAYCYLFESADGTKFVMGFVVNPSPVSKELVDENGQVVQAGAALLPNYGGRRGLLEAGDHILATKDGNMVAVRSGGVVQISATSLCQRLLIPVENLIRDYFQRYEARSPLGEITWGHETIVNPGEDLTTGVLIAGNWRENAQDTDFSVEIRCGKLNESVLDSEADGEHLFAAGKTKDGIGVLATDNVANLSICVFARGGEAVSYKMQVTREGDVFALAAGDVHIEYGKSFYVSIANTGKVEFGTGVIEALAETSTLRVMVQQMVFDQLSALVVNATTANLSIGGVAVGIGGGAAQVSGNMNFGGPGGQPVVVDKDGLLAALLNHTHPFVLPDGTPGVTAASPGLAGVMTARSSVIKST